MNTYKSQSKKPKPITAQQRIDQFKKSLRDLGYDVNVEYGNGVYSPTVSISVWQKREEKTP